MRGIDGVGIGDGEDRVVDGRGDDHHGAVHRSPHLGAGAGEVGDDLVAVDDDRHLDLEGIGGDAVVLHQHAGAVLPVGQLADLGAQAALGVVHQLGGGLRR